MSVKLSDVADLLDQPTVQGPLDAEVIELSDDSSTVKPGSLFVALRGLQRDGHQFVGDAFQRGAVGAIIEDRALLRQHPAAPCLLCVPDSHRALRQLAPSFYGDPSRQLRMVGITGTNGKTTTSYLMQSILSAAGEPAGLIGTVGYQVGQQQVTASHTTPGLLALQRLLAQMIDGGMKAAVMEVSSHALAQGRVEGCFFDVAIFTNLTQDHLDYHQTMEAYFSAKESLFTGLADGRYGKEGAWAVINRDDPWGRRLLSSLMVKSLTYGVEPGADVTISDLRVDWSAIQGTINGPKGSFPVYSPLVGRFNVPNLLAAVSAGLVCGYSPSVIQDGVRRVGQVPGRFEKIDEGQPFSLIVDYAHTEDALRRLLMAIRELQAGRVIVVFGCGGDRDRDKRPKMGAVAAECADLAILTSDNPRSEEPQAIMREVEQGLVSAKGAQRPPCRLQRYWVIEDRRAAITAAIELAEPGDAVVIAGKGHEDYQIIGTTRTAFDDRAVARELLHAGNSGR